jgi:hypothetical protein
MGDSMSSVTIAGDTSGSILLQAPAVSGSTTINIAAQSGTLNVGGPAFQARISGGNQGVSSGVATKVTFNSEIFDTNSNYNPSTYRFTPTVAGYYQINAFISWAGTASTQGNIFIYVNGSSYAQTLTPGSGYGYNNSLSTIVPLNGSTDYVEVYAQNSSSEQIVFGAYSQFSGCFLRGL